MGLFEHCSNSKSRAPNLPQDNGRTRQCHVSVTAWTGW
jgi:hypothetical protein